MSEWIEPVGALNHTRQHRALGQVELPNIFAEVRLCRLTKSVDGKAAPLPEVDLVRVHLEDLLLGEAVLELKRHSDLLDLVLDRPVVGEEQHLCQLHGQRGSAPDVFSVADQVMPTPTRHAPVVHSAVLKEPAVLDSHDRMDEVGRNFVVGEQPALDAVRAPN